MSRDANKDLVLSRQEVRNGDSVAIERYGINGLVLMENAGAAAARFIYSRLKSPAETHVLIITGTGNNGGDGFVVARHLVNERVAVHLIICGARERVKGDALANLQIVEKMNLPITWLATADADEAVRTITDLAGSLPVEMIIDALLGTGTAGPPRQPIRAAIETINRLGKPVVALDIPSGLDCDTGEPLELAVKADHTVTFAARKKGFLTLGAQAYTGDITVASIGIRTDYLI